MKTRKKSSLMRRSGWKAFFMLIPVLVFVFVFSYLPLWGWAYAFFNYKPGIPLFECEFVGWDHFKRLFGNGILRDQLLNSLKNTLGIVGIDWATCWLTMVFAIFLSEIRSRKFQKIVQTVTTMPNFISWVIVYAILFGILNTGTGVLNKVLEQLQLIDQPINFLASSDHVWTMMWAISRWKGTGWGAIVYMSAIVGIDQQLYEAAIVDGANRWQKIWYITIPGLMPTFFVLLIMSIGSFLSTGMEQYMVFQNSMNKEAIEVLDLYVYNIGISKGQISYGTALSMMKSVIALIMFSGANALSKLIRKESVF